MIKGQPAFDSSIYDKSNLVSTVLQDTDGQFIGLSVAEDLAFALENDMVALPLMREKVLRWAKQLDLEQLLDHRPQDLSGGQKQRVSLAAALIGRPSVLFLDEPSAGLDPQSRNVVFDIIREQRKAGVAIILTTHLIDDAQKLADYVYIIEKGKTVLEGTVPWSPGTAPHGYITPSTRTPPPGKSCCR